MSIDTSHIGYIDWFGGFKAISNPQALPSGLKWLQNLLVYMTYFKLRVLCINTVLCVLLYNHQFTVYIVTLWYVWG